MGRQHRARRADADRADTADDRRERQRQGGRPDGAQRRLPAAGAARHERRSEVAGRAALRRHLRRARLPRGRSPRGRVRLPGAARARRECRPDIKYLWQQSRLLLPLSQVRSLREVTASALSPAARQARAGRTRVYRGIETAVDLTASSRRRIERVRIPHGGRRQPRPVDAAARQHDDAAAAFELAASVVPRRVPAGRAHDHRGGLRRALAGARAESLVSPGLERSARSTKPC